MGVIPIILMVAALLACAVSMVGLVLVAGQVDLYQRPAGSSPLTFVAVGAIGFAILFGTGFLKEALTRDEPRDPETVVETIQLSALGNTTSTTSTTRSSFLSSTTTTAQKQIYGYLKKTPGGGYVMGEIDATTEVREDATPDTARIETRQCRFTDGSVTTMWGACGEAVTVIHVPAGSVTKDYQIDVTQPGSTKS